MEILYSIFIGIISSKNVGKIGGIVLQCRRDTTQPLSIRHYVYSIGTIIPYLE